MSEELVDEPGTTRPEPYDPRTGPSLDDPERAQNPDLSRSRAPRKAPRRRRRANRLLGGRRCTTRPLYAPPTAVPLSDSASNPRRPARTRLRTARRAAAIATLAALAAGGAWLALQRPRNDRDWVREQAVLAEPTVAGNHVVVRHVRDFHYSAPGRFAPAYDDRAYDLDSLESVWFILTPFSHRWRAPAHSFVSFGFRGPHGPEYLAISVEARKEVGETYGLFTGLTRQFELMYVIGDERDVIGQRAIFGDYDVFLYPIATTPARARAMFVEMLDRASALRARPEFYNTATNNCTSNLVAHVNRITPHRVPIGIKTILPGYADEVAYSIGLIDTSLSLADTRAKYRINDRARAWFGAGERGDFSAAIRR